MPQDKNIKAKASLEMTDTKAVTMEKQTNKLKGTVNTIETDVKELKKENMFLREALLEIQARSMIENVEITGIKQN
jgi:cell division protein FtsB